jgi:hypothetical protein
MEFASKFVLTNKRTNNNSNKNSRNSDYEPDTNVISAKFNTLAEVENAHTGDPFICIKCDSVLSHISKLNESPDDLALTSSTSKKIWKCEFCNFENKITVHSEKELPKRDQVTYLLEPPQTPPSSSRLTSDEESKYLIYCIDISGSMSITTPVRWEIF